jgi:hypothetical protein
LNEGAKLDIKDDGMCFFVADELFFKTEPDGLRRREVVDTASMRSGATMPKSQDLTVQSMRCQ